MPTEIFEDDIYTEDQRYKDDDKLRVGFYKIAVKNQFKTDQEGRAIYDEVEMIKIFTPGSRDTLDAQVDAIYKHRFRKQYDNWKSKHENETVTGTLLSEIPWLSLAQVAEYNALNIRTVEELVGLPDIVSNKIMGFSKVRERAQRFLDASKGEAPMLQMARTIDEQKDTIAQQAEQIVEMQAAIKELQKQKPAR